MGNGGEAVGILTWAWLGIRIAESIASFSGTQDSSPAASLPKMEILKYAQSIAECGQNLANKYGQISSNFRQNFVPLLRPLRAVLGPGVFPAAVCEPRDEVDAVHPEHEHSRAV